MKGVTGKDQITVNGGQDVIESGQGEGGKISCDCIFIDLLCVAEDRHLHFCCDWLFCHHFAVLVILTLFAQNTVLSYRSSVTRKAVVHCSPLNLNTYLIYLYLFTLKIL